jgi:hypothetical protein
MLSCLHIAFADANHIGFRKVDIPVFGGLQQQAGLGLAAVAVELIGRTLTLKAFIGMVRTIVDGIDEGSLVAQQRLHFVVDGL